MNFRHVGIPENNPTAKHYSITKQGSKQLATDTAQWLLLADVMARVLNPAGEDSK